MVVVVVVVVLVVVVEIVAATGLETVAASLACGCSAAAGAGATGGAAAGAAACELTTISTVGASFVTVFFSLDAAVAKSLAETSTMLIGELGAGDFTCTFAAATSGAL